MSTKYNGPGFPVLHTKVYINFPLVPKKKIFMAFYPIWARKTSGHVTNIMFTYFHFLVSKSLHT